MQRLPVIPRWPLFLSVALALCAAALPSSSQTIGSSVGGGVSGPTVVPRDSRLPATGDARIRGRVIAADTGRPLRRAAVRINGAAIRGTRSTTTGIDGQFEFPDLPAGSYTLNVSRTGYLTMGYRQSRPNTSSRPLVLADHQRADSIDIALPPGGAIAGRVLDEYGEPVAGVAVSAQRLQFFNGARRPMPAGGFTSTNDLGEFRVFGLAPAEYYLSASWRVSPGDESADRSGYAPTYYPSTPDIATAQRLPVRSGETVSSVDVMLVPTRVARITGFVLDVTGAPVKEGSVAASLRDVGFSGPSAANGFVRQDGSFVINGVAPGEYTLRGSLPTPGRPGTWESTAIAYVTVNGADLSNVIVQVQQPAIVSGRIVGDPAALALMRPGMTRLLVVPAGPTFGGAPPPAQPIGDDYSFNVPALPGTVSARTTGTPPGVAIRAVRLNGRDVTRGFEVQSAPIDGLEVEMALATARAVVSVTNGKNEPVADQDVLIFSQDENEWGAPPPGHGAGGRTDANGQFQTPQLLAGPYYVAIIDPIENGQGNDPEILQSFIPSATRVTLGNNESAMIQVRSNER